jgi:hypothetical protein
MYDISRFLVNPSFWASQIPGGEAVPCICSLCDQVLDLKGADRSFIVFQA